MLPRFAAGIEPPEVADSLLKQQWYEPQCSSDIWALGHLMLRMVYGTIPEAHRSLQKTSAYLRDRENRCLRLATSQAQRQHFQYLSGLLQGDSAAYANQVSKHVAASLLRCTAVVASSKVATYVRSSMTDSAACGFHQITVVTFHAGHPAQCVARPQGAPFQEHHQGLLTCAATEAPNGKRGAGFSACHDADFCLVC